MWLVLCRFPSVSVLPVHDGHGLCVLFDAEMWVGAPAQSMTRCRVSRFVIRVEMASCREGSSVPRDLVISFYWRM